MPISCGDCKYYEEFFVEDDDLEAMGFCHRYPPVLQPHPDYPNDRNNDEFQPVQVIKSYWCGEFIPVGMIGH